MFSCKAHVFQLEPEHKKSWISLSSVAVNVQIFHDPLKNIYRIVSIEGTKALINSIVTAKMTFTKTSQKFGQWIDFKLNLVYGLGFANDTELNKFVEKFKEIKEYTRSHQKTHERSNSCEISSSVNRHIIDQNVTLFFFKSMTNWSLIYNYCKDGLFLRKGVLQININSFNSQYC